jgi:Zn-dependent protease with chaperone function
MKSWLASYYETVGAEPIEATVLAVEKKISIGFRNSNGQPVTLDWDIRDINAVFDNSLQATKVTNANEKNARLIINGKDPSLFLQEMQTEQNKPWHKKEKAKGLRRSLVIFLIIAVVLVGTYFLVVPWLSEKLASTVSIQTEERFGDAIYDGLNLSDAEDTASGRLVNEFFRGMNITTPYAIHITVVNGPVVNAFALPGGHIVVYDALLKELNSYPELAALLSHEFTHVNNKHSTKSVFRRLGSRVFLSLLLGKMGNVTSILVDQADNLKSLNYSRKLEKEADMNGLTLLKERKIDPEGFAHLFQHLKASSPAAALPELLASHPDIENRINYIREASANAPVEENIQLKAIFDRLKANNQP